MSDATVPVTLDDIDLTDHDAFVERVPHEWFTLLRHEDPVHWQPERDGPGFWCVTRYQDVRAVHRNPAVFSSELGGTSLEDLKPEDIEARKSMIDMDPPRHDELRALLNRRFTRPAIGVWEEHVRTVTREVLDAALPAGELDFVAAISAEIPMTVFARILGVPDEDRRHIIELGDKLLGKSDPEFGDPAQDDAHSHLPFSSPAALEFFEFGRTLAAARRKAPADDIVTQLALEPLTQQEFDVYFILLATAGNETTRHTISHGLLALMEHPEQLARVREDRALYDTLPDEMLRWATPVHHFRRTAAEDTELGGRRIRRLDKVATWLVSANRDETVFEDPHRFDVGRSPNRQVAFGPGGVHICLGAHLARLEVRVVFEELLPRVRSFELDGPVERLRSNFFNGIKRMPIRVELN
jgi:cytochrome P450